MAKYPCCCCSVTQLCLTLWTLWPIARQASLSLTISESLRKFMSIASVMPSSHLILCCPLLFLPSIFPSIRVFSNELALHIRWPNIRGASSLASVLPMSIQGLFPLGLAGLISLLFKGLSRVFFSTTIQKHQLFGAQPSFVPTLTSIHDNWKNHSFDYMDLCQQSNVSAS